MFLYRVISKDNVNYKNIIWKGINTFQYDDNKEYLHFFFFPEHAEYLKNKKFEDGIILRCNIPTYLLEYGIGLYNHYHLFKKVPFLEARLDYLKFTENFIIEKRNHIDNNWKNALLYKRYLRDCIYNQTSYIYVDKEKNDIKLNDNFDFLYYIYENYNIEELKKHKKILMSLNEKIQERKEKRLIK